MADTTTEKTRFSEVKEGDVFVIVPPTFQALMTGATMAQITPSGMATLTYEDGTTESAQLPYDDVPDSWCKIVGDVQDIARA